MPSNRKIKLDTKNKLAVLVTDMI